MSSTWEHLEGEIIGNLKMLRLIGSGGNGVVYLARQLTVDRIAACKILHQTLTENPIYTKNFLGEARIAARLEHPHIIQAYDVGCCDGLYYFLMEYVPGISLEKIRTSCPDRITQPFLLDIGISLAEALDYAWEKFHIFHGDIKPDNLMIRDRDDALKLADLGLARVAGTDHPEDEIMATPLYAAPEVIMGDKVNVGIQSDIYSFGITLYELLTGRAPFDGNVDAVLHQHLEKTPEPVHKVNPCVDPDLGVLVDSMIAKEPFCRPGNWKEVKNALVRIRKNIPDPVVQKKTLRKIAANEKFEDTEQEKQIFKWILGVILLIAAAAVILFFKNIF